MATIAQIRERAATMLGIYGEGETMPSYMVNDMAESYNEVYAQLSRKKALSWGPGENVPPEYVPHIVSLVAFGRVDDYPTPNDRYARIVAGQRVALLEIRELIGNNAYSTPTADYF